MNFLPRSLGHLFRSASVIASFVFLVAAGGWTSPALAQEGKSASTAADRRAAETLSRRAQALADIGQWEAAALLFVAASKKDPSFPRPLRDAAFSQRKAGNLKGARATYQQFLKRWPGDPRALFGLAESERLLGERAAAKAHFLEYLLSENRRGQKKLLDYATQKVAELSVRQQGDLPQKVVAVIKPASLVASQDKTKVQPAPAAKAAPAKIAAQRPEAPRAKPKIPSPPRVASLVMVMPAKHRDQDAVLADQIGTVLATEFIRARGFDVKTPRSLRSEMSDKNPARAVPCLDGDAKCWSQIAGAGLLVDSRLDQTSDGYRLIINLRDEVQGRETAKVALEGRNAGSLFESLPEGVSALLTAHTLEASSPRSPKAEGQDIKPRRRLANTPSPARADDPKASQTGKAKRAGKAKTSQTGKAEGAGKRKTPARKEDRRIAASTLRERDRLDGADPRRPAGGLSNRSDISANNEPFYLDLGWHAWTWSFVALGLLVGGVGLTTDMLLPTSGNYRFDALDLIGPGAVAVGVTAVVVGGVFNPFWLDFGEDGD